MGAVWINDVLRSFHCFESEFQHCRDQSTLCYEAVLFVLTHIYIKLPQQSTQNCASISWKQIICTSGMMWFDPPTSTCSLTSFLFPPCCSPHLPFSPGCYGTLNRPLANGDGSASRLPTHNCPIKLRLVGAIKQFEASLRSRPQRALLPIPFTCQTCHVLDYDSPLVSFGAVGSFVASLGKNTSSIHRILDNLHESFPMCKLLQVPTHSPQTRLRIEICTGGVSLDPP